MKLLIICSTLDLAKPYGSTPALWQLFKGMYEEGNDLLIIPYHGKPVEGLWWRAFENPNYYKGMLLETVLKITKHRHGKGNSPLIPMAARILAKPQLERLVDKILLSEKDVDAVILIDVPLNQLKGLSTSIKKKHDIPVIFYDIDIPISLPSSGGLTFNHYVGADLDEIDSFIIPSEGSVPELRNLGASQVSIVHFGVDIDAYTPIPVAKDIDFLFFGYGSYNREDNIKMMITEPSKTLKYKFLMSGRYLDTIDIGNAQITKPLSFTEWREYCCRSKVNLNITRQLSANVFATSTSRPFELAAMQCCIVSCPHKGLEKWFEIGQEIMVAYSAKEFIELYEMLMNNEELRLKMGNMAQNRVKKEHTSRHRARQIMQIIEKIR
jgi:spore maturation protein CgeB